MFRWTPAIMIGGATVIFSTRPTLYCKPTTQCLDQSRMDQTSFVGCLLSVDCGDYLGTFQGEVTLVNKDQQTISLRRPYRNGVKFDTPEITIRAVDIRDLKILKSFDEHGTASAERHDLSEMSQNATLHNGTSNVPNNSTTNSKHTVQNSGGQRMSRKQDHQPGNANGKTPTKQRADGSDGDRTALHLGTLHSAFQRVQRDDGKGQGLEEEREAVDSEKGRKQKYHSGNFEANQKVRSSPRKIEGGGGKQRRNVSANARNEECFSAPVESFLATDFDFDKSRKSFNKAAIFEEIHSAMGDNKKKIKNIPHDEHIVFKNIPAFLHDNGSRQVKCSSYTAETGVIIPAVSVDVAQSLWQVADKLGLTTERRLEAGGVSIAKMVLRLIDGKTRVSDRSSILVVCGPHLQGAQGINCARHLANHCVDVTLFMPNFAKMPEVLVAELKLFKETTGKHVTSIGDLPEEPPDLIVSAVDSPMDTALPKQPWLKSIVTWVTANKASVLSIDPSPSHSVRSKWSVITALPLSYENTNVGMLYLCDVGIPAQVFSSIGVNYASPFKDKFIVRLHNH
ncbi:enhancer of mRNA-decapping protein 3-like isoform X2 [Acanthaster planci]|uniref:Enhancer of mRNA-decapping protein 3-like isoform X2 n=1 Tax=Acanthaster planci TaxID=133434 RepID=A0A8B7YWH9_ACAPL|nr:enhancer of mRNA-decapping protein 3-like isoform X2 [Acanthaster planci]